jgi:hypothetical protein
MRAAVCLGFTLCWIVAWADAAEPAPLGIFTPKSFSVTQRQGAALSDKEDRGYADMSVHGLSPHVDLAGAKAEIAIAPLDDALDAKLGAKVDWRAAESRLDGNEFKVSFRAPAGGWYRVDVRFIRDGTMIAQADIRPIGVGEVFLIAGQSYASNSNDERLKVSGPGKIVSVFDPAFDRLTGAWRIADDPQPTPDKSDGGSIWPAFGDLVAEKLQVPVGMVNVAYGGTSTAQWAPGGDLHQGLVKAGKELGRFRAVLWQQGESDVIEKTSTDDYVKNLVAIRDAAAKEWGESPEGSPVWLLAKSTLHPTVYDDPEGRERIRKAIDLLSEKPGFRLGPDTDTLDGENRGSPDSRRHFSAIGQRRAAQMWFESVGRELGVR